MMGHLSLTMTIEAVGSVVIRYWGFLIHTCMITISMLEMESPLDLSGKLGKEFDLTISKSANTLFADNPNSYQIYWQYSK